MQFKLTQKQLIWCHLTALTLVVWLIFYRTLSSYFIADDFGEIAYIDRIFNGEPGLVWLNFTGNFMQIPSMSVWRPLMLVTLIFDYALWHVNSAGFFFSNVLSFNLTVLLLYWFLKQLSRGWGAPRSNIASFMGALLYAVNPFHCECLTWVVGRGDPMAAVLYLLSLNLFIQVERASADNRPDFKKLMILALTTFWMAMWVKETPIGIPVLVPFLYLLFGKGSRSILRILKLTAPLWILTIVYLVLRYFALGTLLGGYVQGIGDAQAANAVRVWLDKDVYYRILYPFAYSLFGINSPYHTIYQILYSVLATLLAVRLLTGRAPLALLVFLPVWILTTLIPIYKLWGLGLELEGARFLFLLSMPLSAFFPMLLFAPSTVSTVQSDESRAARTFMALSMVPLLLYAFFSAKVTYKTNLAWVHSGREVKEFCQKSIERAQTLDTPTLLLGIPKRHGAAHQILNGLTFNVCIGPPFNTSDSKQRSTIYTFDPIIFGNANWLNNERFKELLRLPKAQLIVWNGDKRDFETVKYVETTSPPELDLPMVKGAASGNQDVLKANIGYVHTLGHALVKTSSASSLNLYHIQDGDCLAFSQLNISPLACDYLQVKLKVTDRGTGKLSATFRGVNDNEVSTEEYGLRSVSESLPQNDSVKAPAPGRDSKDPAKLAEETIYLPLSQNWRWYAHQAIETIFLQLPPGASIDVLSARLMTADQVAPALRASGLSAISTGVYQVLPNSAWHLSVDRRDLPGAVTKIELDITKPNSFLENLAPHEQANAVMKTLEFDWPAGQSTAQLDIPQGILQKDVCHQLRVRLKDFGGKSVGQPSTPLIVQLH
jgi:hypothetical protein